MILFSRSVAVLLFLFLLAFDCYSQEIPASWNFYDSTVVPTNLDTKLNDLLKGVKSSEESTLILQDYINKNQRIILPPFEVLISKVGLYINDNKHLIFQQGSILRMEPNELERNAVINLINSKNVTISNPYIIGDKDVHAARKGEWGMGINILGSNNVRIHNFYIENCWGDAIYVGRDTKSDNYSQNIKILQGLVHNNRRNGISITSVDGLILDKVTAAKSQGTPPEYGIDIEPNGNVDVIDNLKIGTVYTYYNAGGGMMITLDKMGGELNKKSRILIKSFKDRGSHYGIYLARLSKNSSNTRGWLKVRDIELFDNDKPILIKNFVPSQYQVQINSFDIINPRNKNWHNDEVLRTNVGKDNLSIRKSK